MYFTNTPSLNSMEAMMIRTPNGVQRGGGKNRSPYKYTKKDCDCRFCLYYRKKDGCTVPVCPVLDIRLGCGAAYIRDAIKAVFKDAQNTAFQKRLSQIYHRKDDAKMIFQNNRHKQIFEAERLSMRKPGKKTVAVLYLLTADHSPLSDKDNGPGHTEQTTADRMAIMAETPASVAFYPAAEDAKARKMQIRQWLLSHGYAELLAHWPPTYF